jgi:hypothetical protein
MSPAMVSPLENTSLNEDAFDLLLRGFRFVMEISHAVLITSHG